MATVTQPQAVEMAATLAACFPNSRTGATLVGEWAKEFVGQEESTAQTAIDLIKATHDRPPSIREIKRALLTGRHRVTGFSTDDGVNSPCIFCGQRVKDGPDAASRFDKPTQRWINVHLPCAEGGKPDAQAQAGRHGRAQDAPRHEDPHHVSRTYVLPVQTTGDAPTGGEAVPAREAP
jgi:hypothetical protein